MFGRRLLRCSFCGKDETQVSKLVAGPKVYICDACVTTARQIMDNSGGDDSTPKVSSSRWRRSVARILQIFSRGDIHGRVHAGAL
jgi:ATP-dependent Clp protease ATP-binding subunit ClpX